MHYLLLSLLTLLGAQAATITDGILASTDTTGTNATARRVTISSQTNLLAGTLTSSNNLVVGGNSAMSGGLSVFNTITNSALQPYSAIATSGTKVLSAIPPSTATYGVLTSGDGVSFAPTFSDYLFVTGTNATLVGNLTANGGNFTNKVTAGSGDNLWWNDDNTAQVVDVRKGTAASPDTTSDPAMKVSRTINLNEAEAAGDGAELASAIEGIVTGVGTNGLMPVGVFGMAYSMSTNTPYGADGAGFYGIGASYGGGAGMGAYLVGYTDQTTNKASGLQLAVHNASGVNATYNSAAFPDTAGMWLVATGGSDSSTGISFGNPFSDQFDVGIGFISQNGGAAKTTTIRDDGNAVTSIDIRGSRTTGISLANGTFSTAAIDATGKAVRVGSLNQSALTLGDASSATFTETFNLSGATDPVLTAANNLLTISTPVTFGNGSAASYVLTGDVSGTDTTLTFGNGLLTSSHQITASTGNIVATGGGFSAANSSGYFFASRGSWQATGDGAFKFVNNAGTGNAALTAGTLTLTPAAADTTAFTGNGYSVTGSGTTVGYSLTGTLNTSGVVPGAVQIKMTNTAAGSGSSYFSVYGGSSGATEILKCTTADNGVSLANGSVTVKDSSTEALTLFQSYPLTFGLGGGYRGQISAESAGVYQFDRDGATAVAQTLKGADGSGTDKAGFNMAVAGGQGTGTGRGGALIGKTSPSGSTGSSANAYSERYHYPAKAITLTSATDTTVATIAVPSGKFVGACVTVSVFATDGTDHQCRTLTFNISAVNKAGAVSDGFSTPTEAIAASTGTLTATVDTEANGNSVDIQINADSSLTETTLSATVSIKAINSNDTAAVTEI